MVRKKSIHVIIPINPKNYNGDIISEFPNIFQNTSIHYIVFGPNAEHVRSYLPKNDESTDLFVEAYGYNYSLAINLILKKLEENCNSEDLLVLTDSWSCISLTQLLKYEFKNTDFNDCFITIDNYYDTRPKKLKLKSKNIMKIITGRSTALFKENGPKYNPVLITTIGNLTSLEHGLDEEFFTEYSRNWTIEQLKTVGLQELNSVKNKGMCIKQRELVDKVKSRDEELLIKYKAMQDVSLFLPSNYQTTWGDPSKIIHLVKDENVIRWNLKTKGRGRALPKYENPSDGEVLSDNVTSTVNAKEENIILQTNKKIVDSTTIELTHSNLIVIKTDIKHLISSTPLIKKVYEIGGPVDILTDDKLNPVTTVINNFMVNKFYDKSDLKNQLLHLKKYKNILKTSECDIGLSIRVGCTTPTKKFKTLSETNYSIADQTISSNIPTPFCHYKTTKRIYPPNTLVFGISIDNSFKEEVWDNFEILISKLANIAQLTILVVFLTTERKGNFEPQKFQIRRNIAIFENLNYINTGGLIRASSLFITHSHSKCAWLAYGIKSRTIILQKNVNEIPDAKWIQRLKVKDNSLDSFNHVFETILENM